MDKNIKGYKKLDVWKNAHEFVLLTYRYTKDFPKYELFGITSQIRRAAVSIAANIYEQLESLRISVGNLLNGLIRSLKIKLDT